MELDEQTAALARRLTRLGTVDYAHVSVAHYRAVFTLMVAEAAGPAGDADSGFDDDDTGVHRTVVPGATAGVPLEVFRPRPPRGPVTGSEASRMAPAVVFFHGGGWVVGGPGLHDRMCRALCRRTGAVVVGVDYRSAPENRFPAALEDGVTALRWVAGHALELGVDVDRLAVAGDSAGGNLAAGVALSARDHGPRLAAQAVVCPFVDLRDEALSAAVDGEAAALLSPAAARWFRDQYLGDHDPGDPRASPLCARDLSGMAPAVVATAGHDPLGAQGRAWGERLRGAGVHVDAMDFPRLAHGFTGLGAVSEASARASDEVWDALGRLLGTAQDVGGSSGRGGATCHPADDTLRGS
jgi:acetyl esterase